MQMKLAEQKAARVEGFLNLREGRLLFALARAARGRGAIVEIGSHRGKSTVWIACGSLSGRAAPVYAVDPWERTGPDGRRHQEVFLENIRAAGVEKLVTPIAMR
ncbi:MAG: class I SAM-dependent methyltransferase, partial [Myxococcales bacterium]|nr:class I SAM-dependent methyltransferase [Myxococcales bacterium]